MKYISYFLVVLFFVSCKTSSEKIIEKPNIIFILADDLGWADLPTYGNTFNEAPNLEKMAAQGMTFTNAYAANPVCSPTRASIQTGIYPARIGINDWIPGHWRPFEELKVPINKVQELPLNYETIGEALQKSGYITGYFGKWHVGPWERKSLENYGYDESVVYNGGGFFKYQEQMFPSTNYPEGTVLAEALTNLSVDFIDKNKDRPFFLFVSHFDVHVQLDAQDELIQKYLDKPKTKGYPSNAVYAAMVENIDNSVGRIMNKLAKLNLDDNTLVVFFSDNGGLVTRYDEIPLIVDERLHYYENDTLQYVATSNKPLRGEKGTVFEGGLREPMIVKWPKKVKAGTTTNCLVSSIDFLPTFASIASEGVLETMYADGIDISSQMFGDNANEERTLFWHYPVYHHDIPASAVRRGKWKLIHYLNNDAKALYNLKDDIGEENNLASKFPKKKEELFKALNNWRKSVNAAMPEKNPDFDVSKREVWGKHPDAE